MDRFGIERNATGGWHVVKWGPRGSVAIYGAYRNREQAQRHVEAIEARMEGGKA